MDKNWSFGDTFLGFALSYLVFSLVDILGTRLGLNPRTTFFLVVLSSGLTLMIYMYFYLHNRHALGYKVDVSSKNISADSLIGLVAGILLGLLGVLNILMKGSGLLSLFETAYLRSNFIPSGFFGRLLFLLLFVFFIPFVEELYFRGFMYSSLNKRVSYILAGLVSATLSSILLSGTIAFFYLFLSSFVFSILYEQTESVQAGLVGHGTLNLMLTLTLFIKGGSL